MHSEIKGKKIMNKIIFYMCLLLMIAFSAKITGSEAFAESYSARVSKDYTMIEKLIEKGKYKDALEKVNRILDKNPNDLNARVYLGSIYSVQFKLDAAKREYLKILREDPDNAAAHNGLGLVYYRKTASSDVEVRNKIPELLNQALKEFSKAIEYAPSFYQAYNNAGKILFEQGRIAEAEDYFRKALELKPDYSEAVENYGRVLFSKNQIEAAIREYSEAIRLNSRNSSAYYHLGEALIAKGKYSKAIKHLQTSLFLFPNSAPVHNMLGKAYEMQDNESAAIAEYKKASLIKPEYTSPYLSLAEIYKNRGDEEFAISELRNALAVNPDFHKAKAEIAEITLNIGKIDQTIQYYKELLEVPEYRQEALKGLSKAYFLKAQQAKSYSYMVSKNDLIAVENALHKAISRNPENLELYLALLRVSKASQKTSQSKIYLNHIIKKSRDNRIDHIIRGEAYLAFKEFNKAESEFVKALNQGRGVSDLLKMAEIFTINRAYSAAKIALNRVLTIEPDNLRAKRSKERIEKYEEHAVSKLRVAEGFYNEDQKLAAIEAYRDALSLDPYLASAHLGIAKVFEKEEYYIDAAEHYEAYVNLLDISRNTKKYMDKVRDLRKKINRLKEDNRPVKKFSRI